MNIHVAGCDEQQSGQRFLDSSVPRLIQHVAFCETAGGDWSSLEWDTYPLPAGKDQKLSWGFGGEAPDDGRVAACLSSLDSIKNNRNNVQTEARPTGRGKWCGRWSMHGRNPINGRLCTRRMNCKSWSCSYCGPHRAKMAKKSIRENADALGMRIFLTLTLDPEKIQFIADPMVATRHIKKCWNKFRTYLKRYYGVVPRFITVLEFTKSGTPHLHVLLDRYIPQAWVSNVWSGLGGGRVVWVKRIRDVSRYLSKYLTKDLLLSAPKGSRRITACRAIKLFPKWVGQHTTQEILKTSVWSLLEEARMSRALTEKAPSLLHGRELVLEPDREGFLQAFEWVEWDFSGGAS